MSNALVTTGQSGGFLTIQDDDFALLMGATQDMGAGGGVFLKHNGNNGEFTYGSDQTELPDGSQLAVDFMSFKKGWICWKDEKVVEEIMVSFRDGSPPAKHTLNDHGPYEDGDGWSEQSSINFKMVDGSDIELTFKATGISKINALGKLFKDFGAQFRSNQGLVPVIELGNNEFQSKAKGAKKATKFAPTFKIIEWVDPAELVAASEGAEGDYQGDDAPDGDAPAEELVEAPTTRRATPAPARPAARQAPAPAVRRRGSF